MLVNVRDLSVKEQDRFVLGWELAGGYIGDAENCEEDPWCCPWFYETVIRVDGHTPEEWGASWWYQNEEEIAAQIQADEEYERSLWESEPEEELPLETC